MLKKHFKCLSNTNKLHVHHVMQSVNIQHIDNPDLFHLWYNNQDGSWSFILLTAETNYTNAKRCAYRIVQNEIAAAKQI